MVEICCDLCGRELNRMETQYIATIDIRPTVGIAASDQDPGDRDHLMELHEMLERAADDGQFEPIEDGILQSEFLLCGDCCRRFCEHPLPRESSLLLDFSEN